MVRQEMFQGILQILNLNEDVYGENTKLEMIEFDSVSKLGVISVIDTLANKIIDAELIEECKTIGDLVDLAF